MKRLSVLFIIIILVVPCFSSIRKERSESRKYNPTQIRQIVKLVETIRNNSILDVEEKRSWNSILSNLRSKNIDMNKINTIAIQARSLLRRKISKNSHNHKKNISSLSNINTNLQNRINYLNKRLSEINNRKEKGAFNVDIKNYSDSIKFISKMNKSRSSGQDKIVAKLRMKKTKHRTTSRSAFRTYLTNRIKGLKNIIYNSQNSMANIQKVINNQTQLMKMISNMVGRVHQEKSSVINNLR